jgi:hypothetical protein
MSGELTMSPRQPSAIVPPEMLPVLRFGGINLSPDRVVEQLDARPRVYVSLTHLFPLPSRSNGGRAPEAEPARCALGPSASVRAIGSRPVSMLSRIPMTQPSRPASTPSTSSTSTTSCPIFTFGGSFLCSLEAENPGYSSPFHVLAISWS